MVLPQPVDGQIKLPMPDQQGSAKGDLARLGNFAAMGEIALTTSGRDSADGPVRKCQSHSLSQGPFDRAIADVRAKLLRFLLRRGTPESDGEDVVQQVMLELSKRRHRFEDATGSRLNGYAHRLALGALFKRHRSTKRRLLRETEWCELQVKRHGGGDGEDMVVERERLKLALSVLTALPGELMTPMMLCSINGLPTAQAATLLGLPLGTVKSRIRLARSLMAIAPREAP
jgi:RNA polymerase sigma-70 factor, ECF subfamily